MLLTDSIFLLFLVSRSFLRRLRKDSIRKKIMTFSRPQHRRHQKARRMRRINLLQTNMWIPLILNVGMDQSDIIWLRGVVSPNFAQSWRPARMSPLLERLQLPHRATFPFSLVQTHKDSLLTRWIHNEYQGRSRGMIWRRSERGNGWRRSLPRLAKETHIGDSRKRKYGSISSFRIILLRLYCKTCSWKRHKFRIRNFQLWCPLTS